MDIRTKIALTLGIILILVLSIGGNMLFNARNDLKQANSNLTIRSSQWMDKEHRLIAEVNQITINSKQMRRIFKGDSSTMATEYQKRIYDLKQDLKSKDLTIRNLQSLTSGTMVVRDSFITRLVRKDTVMEGSYNDGYLKQQFTIDTKANLKTSYTYSDTIKVMGIRRPRLKDNGKKHWPNWGLLWGWDEKTLMYSQNPKAKYEGVYTIKKEK